MSINSLGPFTFIRMDANGQPNGAPPFLQRRAELVARPGVPGVGVIDMAVGGEPFMLTTVVDVATQDSAETLYQSYVDAVIEDKYDLIYAGIDYTDKHDTQYVILRVAAPLIVPHAIAVGGLNGGGKLLIAQFQLLPVFP